MYTLKKLMDQDLENYQHQIKLMKDGKILDKQIKTLRRRGRQMTSSRQFGKQLLKILSCKLYERMIFLLPIP